MIQQCIGFCGVGGGRWNRIEKFERLRRWGEQGSVCQGMAYIYFFLTEVRISVLMMRGIKDRILGDVFIKVTWNHEHKGYCSRSRWTFLPNFAMDHWGAGSPWAQQNHLGAVSQRTQAAEVVVMWLKATCSWKQVTHHDIPQKLVRVVLTGNWRSPSVSKIEPKSL